VAQDRNPLAEDCGRLARPRLCAESLGADWAENGFVDTGRPCATIIRPPERGVQEVCNSTTGELSSERIRLFVFRPEGLWCESEAFWLPESGVVFENSTA